MGPAPLPPHERAWRHPSELAAAAAAVEEPASNGRALVMATGVAAAMLAAVMVVAMTPPRSSAPTAVSATTLAPLTVQLRSASVQDADQSPTARDSEQVRLGNSTMSQDNALALIGSPNAVSAAPHDPAALAVGTDLPNSNERVYVLTRSHTYVVRWAQITRVVAPEGAAVVTVEGELVATFVDGELRILVD